MTTPPRALVSLRARHLGYLSAALRRGDARAADYHRRAARTLYLALRPRVPVAPAPAPERTHAPDAQPDPAPAESTPAHVALLREAGRAALPGALVCVGFVAPTLVPALALVACALIVWR